MKVKVGLLGTIVLAFFFCGTLLQAQEQSFVPVKDIKEGMILKGQTVLKGQTLSDFEVRVSGVLRNNYPGENFIIGEILGDYYKETGVIAGMSGSPVYLDGKIVGAVAFSFPFTKKAVAGITPFEAMLKTEKKAAPEVSMDLNIEMKSGFRDPDLLEKISKRLQSRLPSFMNWNLLSHPGGLSPRLSESMGSQLAQFRTALRSPGSSPQQKMNLDMKPSGEKLRDGDAINVHYTIGDLDISAVGTVTKVIGDRFYAFGHPFMNLGKVEYPVSKAKIIDVVPSFESSFKLAETDTYIGKITEDRLFAVRGQLGSLPDLIPIKVKVNWDKPREYQIKMVRDKLLSPLLLYNVISNVLIAEAKESGELSVKVNGSFFTEGGNTVVYDDTFAGSSSVSDLSMMFASLAYVLMDNPVKEFKIQEVALEVTPWEKRKVATLNRVVAEKYRVKPGEKVNFTLYYKPLNEPAKSESVSITVPPLASGEKLSILIGDAQSMEKFDTEQYKDGFKFPESETTLLRALNNIRKNNCIYFTVVRSNQTVFLNGYVYSNLPASVFHFLLPSQRDFNYAYPPISTFREYALPIEYSFEGRAMITLEIQ